MKNIRCTLLCLMVVSSVCHFSGCRSRQDETTASFPAETSSGAAGESNTGMTEGNTSGTDAVGNPASGSSYEYENGAGSMSTDEGATLPGTNDRTDGLGDDISDAFDDMGTEISDAMDDLGGDISEAWGGTVGTGEGTGR